MRGPYERLKYDLRRLWECPLCKRRERTAGSVTFMHCLCRTQQPEGLPVVMKLVEDGVQRVGPRVMIRHEVTELAPPAQMRAAVGVEDSAQRMAGQDADAPVSQVD
jgi:hypothetical protein